MFRGDDDDDDEGFVITGCHEVKTLFTEWQAGYERKMQRKAAEERERQRLLQEQRERETQSQLQQERERVRAFHHHHQQQRDNQLQLQLEQEGGRHIQPQHHEEDIANHAYETYMDFYVSSPRPRSTVPAHSVVQQNDGQSAPTPPPLAPAPIAAPTTGTRFLSTIRRSLSPPRSRAGSRDRSCTPSSSSNPTSPLRASPPRHLSRISDLFADQSILQTRLYAMFTEDSGPVVTLIDRHLHRNWVDSIVPHKALEWTPSGRVTSSVEHLQPILNVLDTETQRSGRERRKRKRQALVDSGQTSRVRYRERDDGDSDMAFDRLPPSSSRTPTPTDFEVITTCLRQGGRNYPLEIFRTSEQDKGWGLASTTAIPAGSLVLIFTGEVITEKEAARRECARKGRYILRVKGFQLAYDAWKCGGPARFLNSDEKPNLRLQVFLFDGRDASIKPLSYDAEVARSEQPHLLPIIAFFSRRDIAPFEELAYDYEKPYI